MKPFRSTIFASSLALLPVILTAQDQCDSLQVLSMEYAPFTDTALQVIVLNETGTLFGYPQFSLVNVQGDTLAREQVNFFGIGWNSPSIHRMDLQPGLSLPVSPFYGTLILNYYTGDGVEQCIFPLDDISLCPPDECTHMQVYLYNESFGGGGPVTTTFNWSVTDENDEIVGSGIFAIDATMLQQDMEDLCLQAGEYALHIEQNGTEGVSFEYGVTQSEFITNGQQATMQSGGSADMPFSYYPGCVAIGQAIRELDRPAPQIIVVGRSLQIMSTNGENLVSLQILDSTGRLIARLDPWSTIATVDLSDVSSGIFLIRSADAQNPWEPQRFFLH